MPKNVRHILLRCLRTLPDGPGRDRRTDQDLLERFVRHQDEAAFAILLERHGPMVLGVCRRALHDEHVAEDVLQATFLVLAQNAGSIRKRTSLGGWLHGVALRLAQKARTEAARAARADMRPGPEPQPEPATEASWREVQQILDDELQRLPESYRLPLVLCYLEGRTRDEAAAELGWTPGRLKGLLERARERLRGRLIRRGLAPAAAGAAQLADTVLAAPVPPLLVITTVQVALRLAAGEALRECGVSGTVLGLAKGGFGIMGSKKGSLWLVFALALGALGTGAGLLAHWPSPAAPNKVSQTIPSTPKREPAGRERPKALASTEANGAILITLKRVKPGQDTPKHADISETNFGVDPKLDEPGWYVLAMLIYNRSVQQELKLKPAQLSRLQEATTAIYKQNAREIQNALRESRGDYKTYDAARRKIQARCLKAFGKELTATLKSQQLCRLVQIQRQRRGPSIFNDPEVEKALKLTPKQHREMQAIVNQFTREWNAEMSRISGLRFNEELWKAKRELATTKVVALLNDKQKSTWREIIGEPFEVKSDPVKEQKKDATRPAKTGAADVPAKGLQISDWGKENNGLRCCVQAPVTLEQGMPLDVRVELKYDRTRLPAGVKALNEMYAAAFFELELVNRDNGKRLTVKPHDPTAGGPAIDSGRCVIPLDGRALKPWQISFPLVMLGDALTPGSWTCQVRYAFPDVPTRWWVSDRAAWDRAGFWHGTVRSGTFPLEVRKETPRTRVFWLPTRLRLEKGLHVSYRKEDAEKVILPVHNGHIVATHVWPGAFIGGDLAPGTMIAQWQWQNYRGGDRTVEYTIEVFETPDPFAHMWMPRMKTLWRRTLSVSATEQEIRRIVGLNSAKGDDKQ